MEQTPSLSVVLPTYKRPDTLRRTLKCLAEQDLEPEEFEVIVIEDGATEETAAVVEEARQTSMPGITFLQNDENRGPGYTQNRGIRLAKAPIILVLADDIWLVPGALRAHLDCHNENPEPEVAVLGKAIQSPELFSLSVFLKHWDQFGMSRFDNLTELPYYLFWGCNISFKKDYMLEHGMFLEHRGRGGGAAHEDVELGFRLHQHGLKLLYNKDAWGYHYHVYTLDQAVRRYHDRGMNWDEFKQYMPDPECDVSFHVLNRKNAREYFGVLRRPNSLAGANSRISYHLLFHAVRMLVLNRVTVPLFWRPVLYGAEKRPWLAKLMNRQIYRAFLYYYFVKGISDARSYYAGQDKATLTG